MYERFFGFRERPFDLVPDPRFLYLTASQREALSMLQYALTTPRGLTLLLGDAGTGKTTMVQTALRDTTGSPVAPVLVSNPTLSRSEFYEFLSRSFSLGGDVATSKTRFLFALRTHLTERAPTGVVTTVILDEAQSLPHELLEEIRLLSNLETSSAKLLNVVLVGQPELGARLNQPELRQLKQRIGLRCELRPLTPTETFGYIAARIRIAGGNPVDVFTREAVRTIHASSQGIPRLVNVICDNVLIAAFASQVKPVRAQLVADVCRDFDLTAITPPEEPAESGSSFGPVTDTTPAAHETAKADTEPGPAGDEASVVANIQQRRRAVFF